MTSLQPPPPTAPSVPRSTSPSPEPLGSTARDDNVWERRWPWWHVGFVLLVVVATALSADDPGLSTSRRSACLAIGAALVVNYLADLGALRRRGGVRTWAWWTIEVALIGVGSAVQPAFNTMLFIAYPHAFMVTARYRTKLAAAVLLTVAVVTGTFVASGFSRGAWIAVGWESVIGLGSAIALGTWITRIIEQSSQRAELIGALEATRAELANAQRQAGVRDERERLAQEIHDTLAQGFTSILMLVQAARSCVGRDDTSARRNLDVAERTARENLAEARSLVAALAPVALQSAPLTDAMRRLAERMGEETGVRVDVIVDGDVRVLGAADDVVLLRVAQEALTNVTKHAAAAHVTVSLTYRTDATTLTVRDDGCGFDPGTVAPGYGLSGMKAGIEQLGGRLSVASRPGMGTSVEVVV